MEVKLMWELVDLVDSRYGNTKWQMLYLCLY